MTKQNIYNILIGLIPAIIFIVSTIFIAGGLASDLTNCQKDIINVNQNILDDENNMKNMYEKNMDDHKEILRSLGRIEGRLGIINGK
jgi:hypothetical protein